VIDMTLWTLCAKQMALVELHIAGLKAGPTAEGSGLQAGETCTSSGATSLALAGQPDDTGCVVELDGGLLG
jgi:hypothetical protein